MPLHTNSYPNEVCTGLHYCLQAYNYTLTLGYDTIHYSLFGKRVLFTQEELREQGRRGGGYNMVEEIKKITEERERERVSDEEEEK